jgi:hypothetical protein
MRFVGIRLSAGRLPLGRSFRRLLGLYLSVLTLGVGFLGMVFRDTRRGWEDRFSGSDVIYDERRPEPAPWSSPPAGAEAVMPPHVAAAAAAVEAAEAEPHAPVAP